jgi:hypothetical protein
LQEKKEGIEMDEQEYEPESSFVTVKLYSLEKNKF